MELLQMEGNPVRSGSLHRLFFSEITHADTRDNDLLNPIYLFINIKYAIPPDLKLVCNP